MDNLNNFKNKLEKTTATIQNHIERKHAINNQNPTGDQIGDQIGDQTSTSTQNNESILYKIFKTVLYYALYIICCIVFLIMLTYIIIIGEHIDNKRSQYTSVYQSNRTNSGNLGQFEYTSTYMGTVISDLSIAIITLYTIIFVLIFCMHFFGNWGNHMENLKNTINFLWNNNIPKINNNVNDEEKEKEIYKTIMLIILFIISILYFTSFGYIWTFNPYKTMQDTFNNLQDEIYGKIDKLFINYILNTSINNTLLFSEEKNENHEYVYKDITSGKTLSQEEVNKRIEEFRKSNYDDKINFDIGTIHLKVNEWLYTNKYQSYISVIKGIKPDQYSNKISEIVTTITETTITEEKKRAIAIDQIIEYRLKILVSSVILINYLNTQNIDMFIKNLNEPMEYKLNIFLHADSSMGSILPPMSVLSTTPLYKTITGPLDRSCGIIESTADKIIFLTQAQKESLNEKYNKLKTKVDDLFKQIKNYDDPMSKKFYIVMCIIILGLYVVFAIQMFWWWRYKTTILKHWFWFLTHYGKLIVILIIVVLII